MRNDRRLPQPAVPHSEIRNPHFLLRHPVTSIDAVGLGNHVIGFTGRKKPAPRCGAAFVLGARRSSKSEGGLRLRRTSRDKSPHRAIPALKLKLMGGCQTATGETDFRRGAVTDLKINSR